jgi:hypothetical protein
MQGRGTQRTGSFLQLLGTSHRPTRRFSCASIVGLHYLNNTLSFSISRGAPLCTVPGVRKGICNRTVVVPQRACAEGCLSCKQPSMLAPGIRQGTNVEIGHKALCPISLRSKM